jgi:hypothetical protein
MMPLCENIENFKQFFMGQIVLPFYKGNWGGGGSEILERERERESCESKK